MAAAGDNGMRIQINPPVFRGSAILILVFVALGAALPERAGEVFSAVQTWVTETFDWL